MMVLTTGKAVMLVSKRILLIALVGILLVSVLPVYADYTLPQFVRIGLMYGNGAPKTVKLESEHGFLLGKYQEREFTQETAVADTTLTVSVKDGLVTVCNADGLVLCQKAGSAGVKPNASGKEQKIKVDGVEYRGAVDCLADGEKLTVVNVVFLDHYLYGVISREMSPSWHQEALKAQAVCARNYVMVHLNKHQADGFDLCSGVHCQAYSGTRVESENSYAPVDDTTRQVLTYQGNLAELYYSASMGPTTEDVKNVWGNAVPYLVSVDNHWEDTDNIPNGRWSGTLTQEEATTIMRNKGYDVGDVTQITVLEYTENDRVLKMQVTGTKGTKTFERESCRTIFNTVTKSQMFTVKAVGEQANETKIQVTNGTESVEVSPKNLVILSADGSGTFRQDALYISDGEEKKNYISQTTSATGSLGFFFEGTGWGHSVGMSQYGAKGMAEAGKTYTEILLHYFPGTNLENAY